MISRKIKRRLRVLEENKHIIMALCNLDSLTIKKINIIWQNKKKYTASL